MHFPFTVLLQEKDFLVEMLVPLMPSLGERSQKVLIWFIVCLLHGFFQHFTHQIHGNSCDSYRKCDIAVVKKGRNLCLSLMWDVKWLEVFLLSPAMDGIMKVELTGTHFLHLRKEKNVNQKHNTVNRAKTWCMSAYSGVQGTIHKAITPSTKLYLGECACMYSD